MACTTTSLTNELQRRHHLWPVATAALGRTVAIGALMAFMLKGEERLTLQIKGDGPLGGVVVDADSEGSVRGYVEHPQVHLPSNSAGKLDVGGAVGHGMLYVMRDMGMRDVYRSGSELQTGEISDDFTYYFATSEQTPSAIGAGVLVETDNSVVVSGGFIVQLLPDATDEDVSVIEQQLTALQSVTDFLKDGATVDDLVRAVVPDADILERRSLGFRCLCSRERLDSVLRSLGRVELESMIEEQGHAEVICHFCNEKYLFTRPELEQMAHELS